MDTEGERAVCEVCEDGEEGGGGAGETSVCVQCRLVLCHGCSNTHAAHPAFSAHTLRPQQSDPSQQEQQEQQPSCEPWTAAAGVTCSDHEGRPVEMYCGQHQQVLCALCACTHHRACPDLTPLTQAAPTFREHVTGRVLSLTNTLANMAGQTDHVRNDFRDLKRRLQNRFQDLHLDLNRRQDDLAMMIQAQEDLALNSLTEAHGDRHFLKVVSSSLAKMAETAPDDVLMARRKSLTSQLDDAEKKPDVTSEIRTGKLTFDEAKMSHLKSQIGKLGHFEGDTVPKTNKCRPKPQSIRVKVPGAVDALIQAEDQSVKATGAELARRLRVGHRVKRSSQWMSEDKDGGSPDAQGTVRHVGTVSVVRGMVQVCWDSGQTQWHHMGRDHVYELDLAQ